MNGESSGAEAGVDGTDLSAAPEMLERELAGVTAPMNHSVSIRPSLFTTALTVVSAAGLAPLPAHAE